MSDIFDKLKQDPIHNYAGIPGLTSWMIHKGEEGKGCTRMFEMTRNHEGFITPHSHRFDFECFVLEGEVCNSLYRKTLLGDGDLYSETVMQYAKEPGSYERGEVSKNRYVRQDYTHFVGDRYQMRASEIHTIQFKRGTRVLFVEGVVESDTNVILEPIEGGLTLQTFEVKPWMFKKG